MLTLKSVTLAALASVAFAAHGDVSVSRRHHELVHRAPQPEPAPTQFTGAASLGNETHILEKRAFSNARGTWYDVGLGACGKHNVPGDFIVALNSPQYGGGYPGPNCFKKIKITYKGITGIATIMDECPGCPYGGLDFSKGLFTHFASLGAGVIYVNWEFVGDGGDDAPAKPKPPKTTKTPEKTSSKPKPPPKSTSTTHKTTSTHTTTHKSTSTSHSSTKGHSSTSATTSSSTATPTPTPTGPQNVQALEDAFLGLAGLLQFSMEVNGSADVPGDGDDGSNNDDDGSDDGDDGSNDDGDDGSDAQ